MTSYERLKEDCCLTDNHILPWLLVVYKDLYWRIGLLLIIFYLRMLHLNFHIHLYEYFTWCLHIYHAHVGAACIILCYVFDYIVYSWIFCKNILPFKETNFRSHVQTWKPFFRKFRSYVQTWNFLSLFLCFNAHMYHVLLFI